MLKRKREREEEAAGEIAREGREEKEKLFRRSKITPRSPDRTRGEGGEGPIIRMLKKWMKECREKWDRMEGNLAGIRRELVKMKGREEEWKAERERMEKSLGELEMKLKKSLKMGDEGEKMCELDERVALLEKGERKSDCGMRGGVMEKRVKSLEREREKRERYERRNNVIIKNFNDGGDGRGKIEGGR